MRAILLDMVLFFALMVSAALSGSLTIAAELARGGLLFMVELISLFTLRRSHRGKLASFEYGIGKIERVITVLIALGLYLSALFTLEATIGRINSPTVMPTPFLVLAVMVANANLLVNTFCYGDFVRSMPEQGSLILESQIRSRLVKVAASAIVVVVMVVACWLADPKAAVYVDAFGALFVIVYMVKAATDMLRESLPDVLDRALPEADQMKVLRALSGHFGEFEHFSSAKSRRSGGHAFVEIDLSFEPDLPLSEVTRRSQEIESDIRQALPDAIVSVIPHVFDPDKPEAGAQDESAR